MMRRVLRLARVVLSLGVVKGLAFAGSVQLVDGTVYHGEVSIDAGIMVRGTPNAKVAPNNVLIARFSDQAARSQYVPGLVLTNGASIAGVFTSPAEKTVLFEAKGIRIPGADIAWAVYQPFQGTLAAELPPGKTGALLPGGDFFEGTIKSADAKSARVLNPIFGPRVFSAGSQDAHAVVLRPVLPQLASFEVRTRDGSRYLALDVDAREPGALILRHPHYDGMRVPLADLLELRAAPARMLSVAAAKPTRVEGSYATAQEDGSMPTIGAQQTEACMINGGGSATWKRTIRGGSFFARVAQAAGATPGGSLIFIVEADGRILFRSPPIGSGDAPQVVRCAVPAAESLTLRVEGGGETRGIWADPVILLR